MPYQTRCLNLSILEELLWQNFCLRFQTTKTGDFLLMYICNFHVLSDLLLNYICKLHWNQRTTRIHCHGCVSDGRHFSFDYLNEAEGIGISEAMNGLIGRRTADGWWVKVNFLLIFICNFHVLSNLLLMYIFNLHWNLNTMFVCQVNFLLIFIFNFHILSNLLRIYICKLHWMWVKAAMTNPIATGEKTYLLCKSRGFEVVNRCVYYPT